MADFMNFIKEDSAAANANAGSLGGDGSTLGSKSPTPVSLSTLKECKPAFDDFLNVQVTSMCVFCYRLIGRA